MQFDFCYCISLFIKHMGCSFYIPFLTLGPMKTVAPSDSTTALSFPQNVMSIQLSTMDLIIHNLSCISSRKKTNFSNLLSYTYINYVFEHNSFVHLVLIKLEPPAEDSVHNTQNFLLHSLLFQHLLKNGILQPLDRKILE